MVIQFVTGPAIDFFRIIKRFSESLRFDNAQQKTYRFDGRDIEAEATTDGSDNRSSKKIEW
jgi:hypothetical protein